MQKTRIYWDQIDTPKGTCILIANEKGICWVGTPGSQLETGITWLKKRFDVIEVIKGQSKIVAQAISEMKDYLSGKQVTFTGPFDLYGTSFQKAVWKEMLAIPYGKTRTYGDIAARIGFPKAPRAVGGACNKNPVAILVPCHRIVGGTGKLTGYGGGLPTKEWLLTLEGYL